MYEYAIIDKSQTHSLADLRSLQDWHLRYQLETVPGVAEVATIGGYVRQYQVKLDPQKLLAYNIPLSMVLDRVKSSTNEVGGRVLDLNGAQYMIRGVGYLRSLDDLAAVSVGSKGRNAGSSARSGNGELRSGHPRGRGRLERRRRDGWRHCGDAAGHECAQCHQGVEKRLKEIAPSLPPGSSDRVRVRSLRPDSAIRSRRFSGICSQKRSS